MAKASSDYLFELPPETAPAIYRPRLHKAELPDPNVKRLQGKIARLTPTLRALIPDVGTLTWKDFWLTPVQAGRICGGICDDAVIERMYEGTGFFNTVNVGRDPNGQPCFRIPLEDCVDFLLERKEGATA